jgi:hypothetical protein
VHFQIYDLNGRILSQGKLDQSSKKTAINISTLNAAMYLIRITNDSDILETLRFVKQ